MRMLASNKLHKPDQVHVYVTLGACRRTKRAVKFYLEHGCVRLLERGFAFAIHALALFPHVTRCQPASLCTSIILAISRLCRIKLALPASIRAHTARGCQVSHGLRCWCKC
jgi:hypothetical protein